MIKHHLNDTECFSIIFLMVKYLDCQACRLCWNTSSHLKWKRLLFGKTDEAIKSCLLPYEFRLHDTNPDSSMKLVNYFIYYSVNLYFLVEYPKTYQSSKKNIGWKIYLKKFPSFSSFIERITDLCIQSLQ